jgi:type VI secretion system protein VasD
MLMRVNVHRESRLVACVIALAMALTGCAAVKVADDTLGDMTKSALEAAGLKKPDLPPVPDLPQVEALRLPRKVNLRISAGAQLNHDAQDRPLSLVLRIYKLKSAAAFLSAPYEAFGSQDSEKSLLGSDILDVREVTLVPGQQYRTDEQVPRDAAALGVVALFNAPTPQRWRFAFDAERAEKSGLVIGAHGCALTVTQGAPLEVYFDAARLGASTCGRG